MMLALRDGIKDTAVYSAARRVRRLLGAVAIRVRHSSVITAQLVRGRLPGACRTKVTGHGNQVSCRNALRVSGVRVTVTGHDNTVAVNPSAHLTGLHITITGDGNRVVIGAAYLTGVGILLSGSRNFVEIADGCDLTGAELTCEDCANSIRIGSSTVIAGTTGLAAFEGTRITIGSRCLFSAGLHFRTGDSHTLTDLTGQRINPSADISIGDHVWVARGVTVLKGVSVANNCVIGAASVVTKRFERPHCVIAGNPARVVREDINWKVERIPFVGQISDECPPQGHDTSGEPPLGEACGGTPGRWPEVEVKDLGEQQ